MLYSYAMGVDNSIFTLEKSGFIIEQDRSNFQVTFSEDKADIWEDFIKSKLEAGFWNEYVSDLTNEVVFLFRDEKGLKKFIVKNFQNDQFCFCVKKFVTANLAQSKIC